MRHMQDAIQAASELSALGGDASAASADPDAPENPADAIARTEAFTDQCTRQSTDGLGFGVLGL